MGSRTVAPLGRLLNQSATVSGAIRAGNGWIVRMPNRITRPLPVPRCYLVLTVVSPVCAPCPPSRTGPGASTSSEKFLMLREAMNIILTFLPGMSPSARRRGIVRHRARSSSGSTLHDARRTRATITTSWPSAGAGGLLPITIPDRGGMTSGPRASSRQHATRRER